MSGSGLPRARRGFYRRAGDLVEKRSSWVITGTIAFTLLLLLPLIFLAPTQTASDSPTGSQVVKLSRTVSQTFDRETFNMFLIVEARDGDMLTRDALLELYRNEQSLRQGPLGPFLYSAYVDALGAPVQGVASVADYVNHALLLGSNGAVDLSSAGDAEVKQVVDALLSAPATERLRGALSVLSQQTAAGWVSPAISFSVAADHDAVKRGYAASKGESYSSGRVFEYFGRDVQATLRGDQETFRAWAVAIDLELELEAEGKVSSALLAVAVLAIALLLLGIFRSLPTALITTLGLGMMIVWLKGLSNLVGLQKSTALDLIVPIAIVVLGVDYAIQSLFRYREERALGKPYRPALGDAVAGVGKALVLAMTTTVVAFAANVSSAIESVVGLGVGASLAIASSLLVLGIFVPCVIMRYQSWRRAGNGRAPVAPERHWLGWLVLGLSRRWYVVLPLIAVVTGFAVWGWLRVETRMDVKDALDPRSDLIVSLDKLDEHLAQTTGESAVIYIEGDLTQHSALQAIRATIAAMNDDAYVGRNAVGGGPNVRAFILDMLAAVVRNPYAREQVRAASGVEVTDADGDQLPDTQEQLEAVYSFIVLQGVPQAPGALLLNPSQVRETFVHTAEQDAAMIIVGIPGTREQEIVRASESELKADLEEGMAGAAGVTTYGLTGSAYIRLEQFDAIAHAMTNSLALAVVGVLALLLAVFRSGRYAIVTLIPVLLVAAWLYGFMYAAGYYLNILTATIAAIAIGTGVDYSIHFTERFRQEVRGGADRAVALRKTASTTGAALFSSALTTIVGFLVVSLAPMPMFSAFGLLTAIMIALSLLMALVALPPMLYLVAGGRRRGPP